MDKPEPGRCQIWIAEQDCPHDLRICHPNGGVEYYDASSDEWKISVLCADSQKSAIRKLRLQEFEFVGNI